MHPENVKRTMLLAWAGWAMLFAATAVIISAGSARTVVPAYREGALSWIAGEIIYKHLGVGGFTYFPQAAILFIPFSLLPRIAGEVVWRLVNIGVFAGGLFHFAGLARGRSGKELFPLMTLVTLPMAWDCARNGQATLALTGLMLLAVVDVARERWWRATLWLSLGVSVKPLMIVLILLIMAIDRQMTWRVGAGLAVTALFPFVTQKLAYVVEQYAACWRNLTTAAHVGAAEGGWTSPFHALMLVGIAVPEVIQTWIRVAGAAATLGLCAIARRRHEAARSAVLVFSLAAVYLMLFSPRTENNTYAMLSPAIAALLALSHVVDRQRASTLVLTGIALALAASRQIEHLLTPHAASSWVSPLVAVLFCGYVIWHVLNERRLGSDGSPSAAGNDRLG